MKLYQQKTYDNKSRYFSFLSAHHHREFGLIFAVWRTNDAYMQTERYRERSLVHNSSEELLEFVAAPWFKIGKEQWML